ncbi:hypothetical protein Rs2_11085 [Raphanus sativus]|nr:Uncharacterized protein Rs2_11080 [Raphanus sativus]KAJ4907427.1 hypothetical protein Rs2_11085 [Raphanus sativus]
MDCSGSGRRTEHALFDQRKEDHFGRSEARDEDLEFVHWLVTTVVDDNAALKQAPEEISLDDDDALFLHRNHRKFPSPAEELQFWICIGGVINGGFSFLDQRFCFARVYLEHRR